MNLKYHVAPALTVDRSGAVLGSSPNICMNIKQKEFSIHRESKKVEERFVFIPPVVLSVACLMGLCHEIEFKYFEKIYISLGLNLRVSELF